MPAWTPETAAAALREYGAATGKQPTFNAWSPAPPGCPSRRTLQALFGSWKGALEAAGYTAPGRGQYVRDEAFREAASRRRRSQAAAERS